MTEEVMIPMRDGIRLQSFVYLPESSGPFPSLMVRCMYGTDAVRGKAEKLVKEGYAVLAQNVRGRHKVDTRFYLHSEGNVRGAWVRGGLSTVPPREEPPDRFTYDPSDPVPTWGGANSGPARVLPMRRGPRDQQVTLYRKDVITYYSGPLSTPLEVTGPLKLILFAASSARDTDFTAKLMDVAPDGNARLLSDGVVRARFRNGMADPQFLIPNEPVRFEIDLWSTSNEFQAGHRIALAISSSNFPRLSRNLNTGGDNARDAEFVTADQTVFHDSKQPSHLILPVVGSPAPGAARAIESVA